MSNGIKTNWPWRLLGVVVVLLCVVAYAPEQGGLLQRVALPLVMGISAIFIVQNVLSVMLAGTLLAGIHSNWAAVSFSLAGQPDNAAWIAGIAYPLISLLCFTVAVAILVRRFRAHIRATHDERWEARRDSKGPDNS